MIFVTGDTHGKFDYGKIISDAYAGRLSHHCGGFRWRLVSGTLADEPFEKFRSGVKTTELRLYDKKRQRLRVGDLIRFKRRDTNETIIAIVRSLQVFPTFSGVFAKEERLAQAGFDNVSAEDAVRAMRVYYTEEEEKQNGVLQIGIELYI